MRPHDLPPLEPPRCRTCTVRGSFCPLPDDLRASFGAIGTPAFYDRGETIFHETHGSHVVFVLCSGRARLVASSREGKRLLLGFAGPGEILGLAEAVLGGAPYECSAIAAEPSILAVIPRETFSRFIAMHSEAMCRVTRALSEQYSGALREKKLLGLGEESPARLAHLLSAWAAEWGEVRPDGVHIVLHVTNDELAQAIASTRETVTRILGVLKNRGIVVRTADEIVIQSSEQLEELAN